MFAMQGHFPHKVSVKRRKFTKEEDDTLVKLVDQYGVKSWDHIAEHMTGRTGRQCRDRYRNYLVPGYFNGQWTQEEDDIIREKYLQFGPKWSRMTQFFSNRSANALKNRWNYFVCRQVAAEQMNNPQKEPAIDLFDDIDLTSLQFEENETESNFMFGMFD